MGELFRVDSQEKDGNAFSNLLRTMWNTGISDAKNGQENLAGKLGGNVGNEGGGELDAQNRDRVPSLLVERVKNCTFDLCLKEEK